MHPVVRRVAFFYVGVYAVGENTHVGVKMLHIIYKKRTNIHKNGKKSCTVQKK